MAILHKNKKIENFENPTNDYVPQKGPGGPSVYQSLRSLIVIRALALLKSSVLAVPCRARITVRSAVTKTVSLIAIGRT